MSMVANPLREFARATSNDKEVIAHIDGIADEIDREHERRMEQCRHETKRAFAKYLRQITAEYERGHKRKSWLAQQEMQLELDVLKYEAERTGQ